MSARSPGEKRRRKAKREREQAAYAEALAAVTAQGFSCLTCKHRARTLIGNQHHCELDSDHEGYAIVRPDYVCPRYEQR